MDSWSTGRLFRPALICLLVLTAPNAARAQIIPIRTAPLGGSDPYFLLPTENGGMGGASLALHDSFRDPFRNPATGTRLRGLTLMASPTRYDVSRSRSMGNALPVGVTWRSGPWSAGASATLQRIVPDWRFPEYSPVPTAELVPPVPIPREAAPVNRYLQLFVGRSLGDSPWSVGVGVSAESIRHEGGSEYLFKDLMMSRTRGRAMEFRLGLLGAFDSERSVDVTLVHSSSRTEMEVVEPVWPEWLYPQPVWGDLFIPLPIPWFDPPWPEYWPTGTTSTTHVMENNLYGFQAIYEHPTAVMGLQHAFSITANWASHPHIPTYEIARVPTIPRDPGITQAYEIGSGWVYRSTREAVAVDVIFQPIFSHTWAVADGQYAGITNVRNRFRFANWILRLGYQHAGDRFGWQVGIQVLAQDYHLQQDVRDPATSLDWEVRTASQEWVEWAPTWGFSIPANGYRLLYAGRLLRGVGSPRISPGGIWPVIMGEFPIAPGNVFVASTSPLSSNEAAVVSHQVSLIIPIGK